MRFSRNLGLLSDHQQDALKQARITICGVGGMGGVAAEALVRMGIGQIIILDHDKYELSNINRQIHCNETVLGRPKVEVIAEHLVKINPDLKVKTYSALSVNNVAEVVAESDLVINGMDDVLASITLEREARRQHKTIVDAWITPYASVFVVTPESPHWEDFLDFPTKDKPLSAITADDLSECLRREVKFTLSQFSPYEFISPELVEKILDRHIPRPSLVPVVWLSGTLMANEAMKIITNQGRLATHWGVFYNQYDHEIKYLNPQREVEERERFTNQKMAG